MFTSKNPIIAKEGLMNNFSLSEKQAQAILEMRLQRLTGLEVDKVLEEYKELIRLEYMFMYNYKNKDDENRYQELKDKKYGKL